MKEKQQVVIIGSVWPEPDSSAAGSRMMQLIEVFKEEGWTITFASPAADSEFSVDLEKHGIDKAVIELNKESFDVWIRDINPDIVLFDRFMMEEQFGWRVAEQCPQAMRILDTEDLHCLRFARQQAWKQNRAFHFHDMYNDIAKREIASILRCDLSLIISKAEMEILQQHFKIDPALLQYVPFLLKPVDQASLISLPSFRERKHMISIGNFLHEPNWNAVLYLKEEIWPLIRKQLPDVELHLYGAYPSQKVYALHKPEQGFLIMGRAENVKEVMCEHRVCLAPLRFGAGLKGKLIDAMQYGTPNITTSIGAEGMHDALPWSGNIADTAEEIAEAAVKLYTDEELWTQAQAKGITILNTCYLKGTYATELLHHIANVQENLAEHRMHNFTGTLLMHHLVSSTKYMSKWIEAKNKLS